MNTPAATAPATPITIAKSMITAKASDARSQANHGDPRDKVYWDAKADALEWAASLIYT